MNMFDAMQDRNEWLCQVLHVAEQRGRREQRVLQVSGVAAAVLEEPAGLARVAGRPQSTSCSRAGAGHTISGMEILEAILSQYLQVVS